MPIRLLLACLFCSLVAPTAFGESLLARYRPADGQAFDLFGAAVAVGASTVLVGAPGDDDNGSGSGSVYRFDASTGQFLGKLQPGDGAAGDAFGTAVAVHGNVAAVGASQDDDNGASSGAAYLFDASTGQQLAKLLPLDGAAFDFFGSSVAIHGTRVLVGAPGDDDNGLDSGSAYLFDASTGLQLAQLLASDGVASDELGVSVGLGSTTAVVGALGPMTSDLSTERSGYAYLFDAVSALQTAKLLPSGGAAFDRFGSAVAIFGTTVAVGAPEGFFDTSGPGSVYLFDAVTHLVTAQLVPEDGMDDDAFGTSVALSGTTLAVGAPGADLQGNNTGSAYLMSTTSGGQLAKIVPVDATSNGAFGGKAAIDGTVAVFGSHTEFGSGAEAADGFDAACSLTAAFCDASDGALASCPCANPGGSTTGCDLSQSTGGVGLSLARQESVPLNRVTWTAGGFPIGSTPSSVVIRSSTLATPVAFGDGLRCIGTPVVRLDALAVPATGFAIHTHGHGALAGTGSFYYQLWFRNTPAMYCTPDAFNLSSGRSLVW